MIWINLPYTKNAAPFSLRGCRVPSKALFTAKHLTVFGLFRIALSKRRGEKRKKGRKKKENKRKREKKYYWKLLFSVEISRIFPAIFSRGFVTKLVHEMLQGSRKTGITWKIWKLKTPVYCCEGGKTPPFCPTLVPTSVASSLLKKAALRRLICPQLLCDLWAVEIAGFAFCASFFSQKIFS